MAFALGACGGLVRILMPSAVNTASEEPVNWPARPLIRYLTAVVRWSRGQTGRRGMAAQRGKRNLDERLQLTLACGATAEAAARSLDISERTVYRRLSDPAFRRRLQ